MGDMNDVGDVGDMGDNGNPILDTRISGLCPFSVRHNYLKKMIFFRFFRFFEISVFF